MGPGGNGLKVHMSQSFSQDYSAHPCIYTHIMSMFLEKKLGRINKKKLKKGGIKIK